MGNFHNLPAKANDRDFPGIGIGGFLINLMDYCATETMIRNTQELIQKIQPEIVVQDNSGFALLIREEAGKKLILDESKPLIYKKIPNPMPIHNVAAALKIKPDILIASDWPVKKLKDGDNREKEFEKKLHYNKKWAIQTYQFLNKTPNNIKLYVAYQGYTLRHMEIFFEAISSIQFDGVSMPIRNQTLGQTALFLMQLWKMGVKNIHLLGVAALFPMALAAFFARHFFEMVTMDASSYKDKAFESKYANPHNLSPVYVGENTIIDPDVKMDCKCSACKRRSFLYYQNLPYTYRHVLLCSHNFWATENMGQELHKHSTTVKSIINFLKSKTDKVRKIEELHGVLSLVEALKNKVIRYLEAAVG